MKNVLGECTLDGNSEMSLLKIFQINQFHCELNKKPHLGHTDLVLFLSQPKKEMFNGLVNDFLYVLPNMYREGGNH